MKSRITGFHPDPQEANAWIAELACGHTQHVRHEPPLTFRPWVLDAAGRARFLGAELECLRCEEEHSG
jgi:Protein of unknown function (DUF3565)